MSVSISPLAPKSYPDLPGLAGVRLGAIEAGIKYQDRKDLCVFVFDRPASIAGVFTKSKCPSAPVDWCRKHLGNGVVRAMVINSGNANAFTGRRGDEAVLMTANAASQVLNCKPEEVFLASTGVIGEPLDASGFNEKLQLLSPSLTMDGWQDAAQAIMTTDTYPKLGTREFVVEGRTYHLNGIAKGSGMIAPDMATMLAFLVTNLPVDHEVLQNLLSETVKTSFNAITVDSDTSTSDTVLLASCGDGEKINDINDKRLEPFLTALQGIMHDLAMLIVRDGEGATKHVEITVDGAASDASAWIVAMAIANSPLVKTAIAGEDANWGRIVMAVGKSGEEADRDKLQISFGDLVVARNGERVTDYSEDDASLIMKQERVNIGVELGIGTGSARVWTCDLTKQYVAINGDYRS